MEVPIFFTLSLGVRLHIREWRFPSLSEEHKVGIGPRRQETFSEQPVKIEEIDDRWNVLFRRFCSQDRRTM